MDNITRKKVIANLIWRFLERIGSQGLLALVTILLARLLSPSVFGIVARLTESDSNPIHINMI